MLSGFARKSTPATSRLCTCTIRRHGEQRRRQVDDRDRDESGDQESAGVDRAGVAFAERFGFRRRPKAHGGEIEIFTPEQPGGGEKEDHGAEACEEKERHGNDIDCDREQRSLAAF